MSYITHDVNSFRQVNDTVEYINLVVIISSHRPVVKMIYNIIPLCSVHNQKCNVLLESKFSLLSNFISTSDSSATRS